MHTIERSTFEDFCSVKKHASCQHITRSVPGMKSLLPLRLLSPTVPEIEVWPSSGRTNRSTFGMNIVPTTDARVGSSQAELKAEQSTTSRVRIHRSNPYRDMPIYSEPGSPLLNHAYLTDEEAHSSCNTSESDEWFEAGEVSNVEPTSSACVDEPSNMESPPRVAVDHHFEDNPDTPRNRIPPKGRSSNLSFQCSGEAEALFFDEAAWLRSPLNYHRLEKSSKVPRLRNVESWLSDASSCGDDREDLLSHATAISPVKAHVIDVNAKPPSGLSIHVPPRSSSLAGTTIIHVTAEENRDSWLYSAYSPPATPRQPLTAVRANPQKSFEREFDFDMPERRLDLAMTSPPASPTLAHHDIFSEPHIWQMSQLIDTETKVYGSQSTPIEDAGLSSKSINDILTSLENLTAHFPSGTLQPDTPCILAIRSQLAPTPITSQNSHPRVLLSPFFSHQPPPPDSTLHRRQTTNFSKPRRTPSAATSKSCPVPRNPAIPATPTLPPRSTHDSTSHSPRFCLPPPDMQPLHRIFPNSSKFMRSSLYAYVLAHIFASSLTPPTSPSNGNDTPRFPKKRRDTPYWPTTDVPSKAADVLGLSHIPSPNEEGDFGRRVEDLKERLRKGIRGLVGEMEYEGREGSFDGVGLLFIKSLEEVVRGCEGDAYRSF